MIGGEGGRPKDSTCLDFFIPDGKGSRLCQLSAKHSDMLPQAVNLFIHHYIPQHNGEIWDPIFGMDRITIDLYAVQANSMTLISERATIMPQASTSAGVSSQYHTKCSVIFQLLQ